MEGVPVRQLEPAALGESQLTLTATRFWLDRTPIEEILLRTPPWYSTSAGFDPADQAFADSEIAATLLAAGSLPSVLAVNRLDATAWFEQGRWSVWHHRLEAAGLPVTTYRTRPENSAAAGQWHPQTTLGATGLADQSAMAAFTGLTTAAVADASYLAVGGRPLDPAAPPIVFAAAARLHAEGLALAAIAVDPDGAVQQVNPFPEPSSPAQAMAAGRALARLFDDHRHRR